MSKVKYNFCPKEGRYAAKGKDELIYQDNRVVNTDPSTWVEFDMDEGSENDKFWSCKVISKRTAEEITSQIKLTNKQLMIYNVMKDQPPMSKKDILSLTNNKASKASIHRALTYEFKNLGIIVKKDNIGSAKLFSIDTPSKEVILKDKAIYNISKNKIRDDEILKLHSDGMHYEDIAEKFNITKQRVYQIVHGE